MQLVFTISAVKIRRFVTMAVAEIREVPPRGHDELHLPNGAQDAREASAAGSTVFLPRGDCRGAAVFNNGKKFMWLFFVWPENWEKGERLDCRRRLFRGGSYDQTFLSSCHKCRETGDRRRRKLFFVSFFPQCDVSFLAPSSSSSPCAFRRSLQTVYIETFGFRFYDVSENVEQTSVSLPQN